MAVKRPNDVRFRIVASERKAPFFPTDIKVVAFAFGAPRPRVRLRVRAESEAKAHDCHDGLVNPLKNYVTVF